MVWASVHSASENSDHFKAQFTESVFSNQDMSKPPSCVGATRGYRLPSVTVGMENSGAEHPIRNRDKNMSLFIFYGCICGDAAYHVLTRLLFNRDAPKIRNVSTIYFSKDIDKCPLQLYLFTGLPVLCSRYPIWHRLPDQLFDHSHYSQLK